MDYRKLAEEFLIDTFTKVPPFAPPEDMNKGEMGIITYLASCKNNVLSGELSNVLKLSSGRVAIALKSLEKKGFIYRSSPLEDKRKVVVSITEKGQKCSDEHKEKAIDDFSKIFKFIGPKDTKEFLRILYKIFDIEK